MSEREAELESILDEMSGLQCRLSAILRGASPDPIHVITGGFADIAGAYLRRLDFNAPPVVNDIVRRRFRMFGGPWLGGDGGIPESIVATFPGHGDVRYAALLFDDLNPERAAAIYAWWDVVHAARRSLVCALGQGPKTEG